MMIARRERVAEAIATQIAQVAKMVGGAVLSDNQIDQIACVAAQDVLHNALASVEAAQVVEDMARERVDEEESTIATN